MKKILVLVVMLLAVVNTGCVSSYVHSQWKEARQKQAVRVEADGSQVMVGVDVTALDYFKENPGLATLAAIADAGIAYGAYKLGRDLLDDKASNNQRNTDITVNGNQNSSVSINISGDQDNDPVNNNDTSNNNYE